MGYDVKFKTCSWAIKMNNPVKTKVANTGVALVQNRQHFVRLHNFLFITNMLLVQYQKYILNLARVFQVAWPEYDLQM